MNLLKVGSKRRRTNAQILAEKEETKLREEEINAKVQKFEEMEAQIKNLKT